MDLLILEIDRLILEKNKESKEVFSLEFIKLSNMHKYQSWLAEVTPEAARNIEQREQEEKEKEEKELLQRKEEKERIEKSWKEAQERKKKKSERNN